jgi:hypothetical protein
MKLVTGIMPTRGRTEYATLAVACFLAQDYENKRLVILDDADDPSFPNGFSGKSISYTALKKRMQIGAKRNIACELAFRSDYIAHFDSDDWSAPRRLTQQIDLLERTGKAVTGYNSLLFYEPKTGGWARWTGGQENSAGTSLVYTREWWSTHRFKDQNCGEDHLFRDAAKDGEAFIAVPGEQMMVARAHPGNTSKKHLSNYRPVSVQDVPADFPL